MPSASDQPGIHHLAPSENARDTARGRAAEPQDWRVEGSVVGSSLEATGDALGWLVTGTAPLSLRGRAPEPAAARGAAAPSTNSPGRRSGMSPESGGGLCRSRLPGLDLAQSERAGAVDVGLYRGGAAELGVDGGRLSLRYRGDPADVGAAILSAYLAKLRTISTHVWTVDGSRSCFSTHGQDLDSGPDR